MFGCGWVKRSDGRRNSSQSGNGTGKGLQTVSPFVERGAAAVAVEAVGGGGLPRRTSQPRRRNNSAPREHFSPFVFSFPHLSGFIAHSQNNQNVARFQQFQKRGSPRLFFSFFFFYFFFSLSLLFFYLFFFFYITFLFFSLFVFSVSLFVFLFYFFFFSLLAFLQLFRRRQRVSLSPFLFPSFPLCRLFALSIIKRPGA